MFRSVLIVLAFISCSAFGQERPRDGKDNKPVLHEVSNKDIVMSIYPEAAKVEKVNDYWFRVLNSGNKTIGFAMSSASFCKDVKGYNGVTPVLILTDKNWIIKKVALLSNWESVGFVRKLEKRGFFDLWAGKSLKEAKSIQVDAHTGATFTATAVSKNVDFLLKNGSKKLPR